MADMMKTMTKKVKATANKVKTMVDKMMAGEGQVRDLLSALKPE